MQYSSAKTLGAYLILVALSGCSNQMPTAISPPPISANLLSPCPALSPLDDGTAASVLRKLVEVGEAYQDCAARHDALAEAVK